MPLWLVLYSWTNLRSWTKFQVFSLYNTIDIITSNLKGRFIGMESLLNSVCVLIQSNLHTYSEETLFQKGIKLMMEYQDVISDTFSQ